MKTTQVASAATKRHRDREKAKVRKAWYKNEVPESNNDENKAGPSTPRQSQASQQAEAADNADYANRLVAANIALDATKAELADQVPLTTLHETRRLTCTIDSSLVTVMHHEGNISPPLVAGPGVRRVGNAARRVTGGTSTGRATQQLISIKLMIEPYCTVQRKAQNDIVSLVHLALTVTNLPLRRCRKN